MSKSRRHFLKTTGISAASLATTGLSLDQKSSMKDNGVEVVNPRHRVPVSFIIDDSTTLVNLAHFGIPQFAEVFPENYKQDWRSLPREIPDSFVREFGEWCHEHGIKGKYSIVPYPACTGWVNQFIPGWTKKELEDSLQLVRDLMVPDWDIHPEMISHTRVIDIKTGRPFPFATPDYMENWEWSQQKSADELAAYQTYALQILKDAGLYCDGLTTPGGYGSKNKSNLAQASLESVRGMFNAEIPHYFRDLYTGKEQSVAPQVLQVSGLNSHDPKCVVSIIGCTGDWFGGWDGLTIGNVDKFITEDLQQGRMVDVIDSGEPAVMVCHWPGIYYNGEKIGFNIFKEVVKRIHEKYDHLQWMKLSEIARYWAAKELTTIDLRENTLHLHAPFSSKDFTLSIARNINNPRLLQKGQERPLQRVANKLELKENTWCKENGKAIVCFNLDKGENELSF